MENSTNVDLAGLNAFLHENESVDFRTADLNHPSSIEAFQWDSVVEEEKENLVNQLKAYQRILRVLPDDSSDPDTEAIAKELLNNGIHSALQIAGMPKKSFIKNTTKIFNDNIDLAERVYQKATLRRKTVALQYLNRMQQLEPHAQAAGLHL